jgi:hypothetical protein
MRKTWLASAAILGASGGFAVAQNSSNPLQGEYIAPWFGGPSVQNNNNARGTAVPGAAVTPPPGNVVIRLNGSVYAGLALSYGTGLQSAPGTLSNGAATNPGGYKLNPIGAGSISRLQPGLDGVATNGLRYGASVEIGMNVEGGNNFQVTAAPTSATTVAVTSPGATALAGNNSSPSGASSAQTLYLRRAFVYVGADQLGIVRAGQQNGLEGIYDATGVFTIGNWDGGISNIDNSGLQSVLPSQYLISWGWLTNNTTEYTNNKLVYLSPSFLGVDFGLEFGPNQGNSFANSSPSSPFQVGPCDTASADCIGVTSGTDASRWINRFGIGARFIETIGGVTLQGYGEYIVSGHADNPAAIQAGPTHLTTGSGGLKYDGQNLFNGGLAASYMGFTVNGDITIGRTNGSNGLDPTGGVPMHAELAAISYANGPYSVGAIIGIEDSQGSAALVHTSQRHEVAFAVGGAYRIAPGINLCLEYQYVQKHQGGYNFNTSVSGPTAAFGASGTSGNDIHAGGLLFATIVYW